MTADARGGSLRRMIISPQSSPAAAVPSAPARPRRLPTRLRVARGLALVLGTLNAAGAVFIGITQASGDPLEWALGAVILALALAWWPVALRLAPDRPGPARAAVVLAVLGIAHAVYDVLNGWYESAVFGVVCAVIIALVRPYVRAR